MTDIMSRSGRVTERVGQFKALLSTDVSPSLSEIEQVFEISTDSGSEMGGRLVQEFELFRAHVWEFKSFFDGVARDQNGVNPYSLEDLASFCMDPLIFGLGLKKERGEGVLYGNEHVTARRRFVNGMPVQTRLFIFRQKFLSSHLFSELKQALVARVSGISRRDIQCVVGVCDIGMAHSVYLVELEDDHGEVSRWVVKQASDRYEAFYCELLVKLGWPSFFSTYVSYGNEGWEVSEYLGKDTLSHWLQRCDVTNDMVDQLARHAVLGDILGRGDRHLENYMVDRNVVFPIDISFLFSRDNDEWVQKYVSGGMIEVNAIGVSSESKLDRFFKAYDDGYHFLKRKQNDIEAFASAFFSEDGGMDQKLGFIRDRLDESRGYLALQRGRYEMGISEMRRRFPYREKLSWLYDVHPGCLSDPLLSMYAAAHKGRHSTFFLLEEGRDYLLDMIDRLYQRVNTM